MGFLSKLHASVFKDVVVNHFREHHDIEDLEEECWTDLINEIDNWKLENIPVAKIYLYGDRFPVTEAFGDDEEQLAKNLAKIKTKLPAIIVEKQNDKYITIDGAHRSRAAYLRGDSHISAYVGIKNYKGH